MAKKRSSKSTKKNSPEKKKKVIAKVKPANKKAKAKTRSLSAVKKPAKGPVSKPKPQPKTLTLSVKVGDLAPSFSLQSDADEAVSLSQFRGKTVVLFFYPKDMTPGCTQEACDFRDGFRQFQNMNAVILGISRDPVKSHQKFKARHGLNFPLLADVDGNVCQAYGVWQEKSLYGRKYMGILRSTVVIGPDGRIQRIVAGVKVDGHALDILHQL